MYTPFRGEIFLQDYRLSRIAVIKRHNTAKFDSTGEDSELIIPVLAALTKIFQEDGADGQFQSLLPVPVMGSTVRLPSDQSKAYLKDISISELIFTSELLRAIITTQLWGTTGIDIQKWLNLLVQRFEVTKKIYEAYHSGFKKGEGSASDIRLYWLFAVALCLTDDKTGSLKYLNTLIKVCDLLCSLPDEMNGIPANGLSIVLAAEIIKIELLAIKKGIVSCV